MISVIYFKMMPIFCKVWKFSFVQIWNLFAYFPTYWKTHSWAQLSDTAYRNIIFFYMMNTCDIRIKPIFCLVLTNTFGQFLATWLHFQSETRSHKLLSRITSILILFLWHRDYTHLSLLKKVLADALVLVLISLLKWQC